ncbi:hypothetical protein S7335_4261 [Synechococcus sp. PCC 7335]|uniref:hypothetical protein n=1 Tax=Synechococcus sp. (strain ATCC 29403 / PCC 7335) TaxID=91464 RepID=UPI00017EC714|nr:hypothetical protein [Synechococcus sp. PCC 7335]EDX86556.1 hypothetical protein S7335_4261 [Synechococcus sp. PCC 7335]
MTIEFIDHALNIVLAGLLYGSEAWVIGAFGLYIATRESPSSSSASAMFVATETTDVESKLEEIVKAKSNFERSVAILPYPAEFAQIVCEPVDWKQWKVSDLRKASVAKTCGVRTRPIGSRRNLPKPDLIAQYKQQLKRLTKVPTIASAQAKDTKKRLKSEGVMP